MQRHKSHASKQELEDQLWQSKIKQEENTNVNIRNLDQNYHKSSLKPKVKIPIIPRSKKWRKAELQ